MRKIATLTCLAVITLLVSCNHTYKEYDKEAFPTYIWEKGQEVIFKPELKDFSKSYKLTLGIRHLYILQVSDIPVSIKIVSPSGKENTKAYTLKLKDENGEIISDCGGDMCDLETVVEENIKFEEAGTYQFIVTHNIRNGRVPGILELGLIVDENKE